MHFSLVYVGTFAKGALIIGNSVDRVIASSPELTQYCMPGEDTVGEEFNDSTPFLFNGEITTCREVKVDVVVTLALLSGLIMVSGVREGGREGGR